MCGCVRACVRARCAGVFVTAGVRWRWLSLRTNTLQMLYARSAISAAHARRACAAVAQTFCPCHSKTSSGSWPAAAAACGTTSNPNPAGVPTYSYATSAPTKRKQAKQNYRQSPQRARGSQQKETQSGDRATAHATAAYHMHAALAWVGRWWCVWARGRGGSIGACAARPS